MATCDLLFLQLFVNPGDGQRVVLGGLENPFLDRLGDFYPGSAGDEGYLRLLHQGDDRHRVAGGAGSDDRHDLVFLDQPCGSLHGFGGIPLRIVHHKLQRAPLDPAGFVDLVHNHLSGIALRFAEE